MPHLSNPSAFGKRLSVSDGRTAVGAIEQSSGGFLAIDIDGQLIGTFQTLTAASRALPTTRSS
jgi:hypothetical protein